MFVEIEIEGEKILVENADDIVETDLEGLELEAAVIKESLTDLFRSKVRKATEFTLEKLTNLIKKFAKYIYNSCTNIQEIQKPDELTLEFSVGFSITGNLFIAKSTANSGIKVAMKWKKGI